jgi:hypothetical protein
MPLTTTSEMASRYGGDPDHFAHVLDHLFVPAVEQAGFTPKKPIAEGADLIHAEIVRNLETADLVLCDISALNANVFFEFGIRTALDRPICLVRDEHTKLPFDVGGINCHQYASSLAAWELAQEIERLAQHIGRAAERGDGHNALWRHFGLTQRGAEAINAVPADSNSATLQLILEQVAALKDEREGVAHGRDLPLLVQSRSPEFVDRVTRLLQGTGTRFRLEGSGRTYRLYVSSLPPGLRRRVVGIAEDCDVGLKVLPHPAG